MTEKFYAFVETRNASLNWKILCNNNSRIIIIIITEMWLATSNEGDAYGL